MKAWVEGAEFRRKSVSSEIGFDLQCLRQKTVMVHINKRKKKSHGIQVH